MTLFKIWALSLLLVGIPYRLLAEEGEDLSKIAGQFERHFQDASGAKFRAVKEVVGDRSTVTTYDGDGNVVEGHASNIVVEQRGPVKVLSFSNLVVIAGPNKGLSTAGRRSYIYRLEDDTFTEAWGLLEEDDSPPRMFTWRRIKQVR